MPEATKIIIFPGRVKPRALPPHARLVEFAELSEIILIKRAAEAAGHLDLPESAESDKIRNRFSLPATVQTEGSSCP